MISLKSAVGSVKDLNVKKKQSRFYSRTKVNIGQDLQEYTKNLLAEYALDSHVAAKRKYNTAIVIGFGHNTYYKLNERFALLAGLESQIRYSTGGDVFRGVYESAWWYKEESFNFKEYFRLNAKLGFKVNLNKKVSVETYGLVGMNIIKLSNSYSGYG